MNKNKLLDKIVMLFILLSPILDLLSFFQDKYLKLPFSISFIIRGVFLIGIIIYLFRRKDNRKMLFFFLLYFILTIGSYLMRKLNIYNEIVNLLKIFYLPILMLFFSKYNNTKIDDKFILKVYVMYIITFIIMFIFKMDREYVSVIGAVLVGLLPITLNYVMESKSYILKTVFYILLALIIYLVGTRLIVTGTFVVILGMYAIKYKYEFIYNGFKRRFVLLLSIIGFIVIFVLLARFSPFYNIMKETITSLNIHSFRDIYRFNTIDKFIFTGGLSEFADSMKNFIKGGYDTVMYGLGVSGIKRFTEIDAFDILLTTGIFGSIVFIIMFTYTNFRTELKKVYYFSYIMFIAISLFCGRALIYPSVSLFIAVVYLLSTNSIKIKKKESC